MNTELFINNYLEKMILSLEKSGSLIIGYDFDDTVHSDNEERFSYPYVEEVRQVLKDLSSTGKCRFIVITCREGDKLKEAEKFLFSEGLPYNAINHNLPWSLPGSPRKIYCNIMIDDKCGLPLSLEILQKLYELIK